MAAMLKLGNNFQQNIIIMMNILPKDKEPKGIILAEKTDWEREYRWKLCAVKVFEPAALSILAENYILSKRTNTLLLSDYFWAACSSAFLHFVSHLLGRYMCHFGVKFIINCKTRNSRNMKLQQIVNDSHFRGKKCFWIANLVSIVVLLLCGMKLL